MALPLMPKEKVDSESASMRFGSFDAEKFRVSGVGRLEFAVVVIVTMACVKLQSYSPSCRKMMGWFLRKDAPAGGSGFPGPSSCSSFVKIEACM